MILDITPFEFVRLRKRAIMNTATLVYPVKMLEPGASLPGGFKMHCLDEMVAFGVYDIIDAKFPYVIFYITILKLKNDENDEIDETK